MAIIDQAMRNRAARGLRLEWFIPSEGRNFTAYAKDEAQKQAWLERGEQQGWELISD